jgi:hypothetical protein
MFHPKHVELFAGNKILYKSVILLEHSNIGSLDSEPERRKGVKGFRIKKIRLISFGNT